MLYALDTEFMEDGKTIELISIGLVAEDGRTLYAQNRNANLRAGNPFVQAHVIPALEHHDCRPRHLDSWRGRGAAHCAQDNCPWLWKEQIADVVAGFVAEHATPRQFLTYYGAYDWVVLCQLFGRMCDLPPGWPMYAHDLRSWLDLHGYAHVTQPDGMPHHALSDAQWIMETWKRYHDA